MKRILRRIFGSNEVEFQLLKSTSSVEIGTNENGKPRRSRSRQFPRFFSQHERLNFEVISKTFIK